MLEPRHHAEGKPKKLLKDYRERHQEPEPACQMCDWAILETDAPSLVTLPQLTPHKQGRLNSPSSVNCSFLSKINDYCFKPLSLGMVCYTIDKWNINFLCSLKEKVHKNSQPNAPHLPPQVTCERQGSTMVRNTDFGARWPGFEYRHSLVSLCFCFFICERKTITSYTIRIKGGCLKGSYFKEKG